MTCLRIHHLGLSQSERIIWLCEELGLRYDLRRYERTRVTRAAPADYQALHPMGIAPVIEIDGRTLAESGAIVEYVVHRLGGGRLEPRPEDASYADWLFWFHFANGTLMPSEMMTIMLRMIPWTRPIRKAAGYRSTRGFALTEARLMEVPWLAGDAFTTADIMMAFPFTTARVFTRAKIDDFPNIRAWLARIGSRPAYRRAMAAGDPGFAPLLT